MRLATWNVNSIRARVDRVVAFLDRSGTDVLAMQETKCRDDQFPWQRFADAGYEVAHVGTSQWNGVAIASRVGLDDVVTAFPDQPGFAKVAAPEVPDDAGLLPGPDLLPGLDLGTHAAASGTVGAGTVGAAGPAAAPVEARALGATCGGVRVWSLYVPNGRELGDPHYAYKLDWLARLDAAASGWLDPARSGAADARIALLGDWNVAPQDTDVWDIELFAGRTHVSQPERDAFAAFAASGYREVTREHLPAERTYTYWDYTQLRFPRGEGMRIDFAYCSPALADDVTGVRIDRDERKGKGASDHAPVILDVEEPGVP